MNPWLEYNTEELIFRNGASVLMRNGPRQLYNEPDQTVAIYGLTAGDHKRLLAASASPLKDIFYFIRVYTSPGGRLIWQHRFRHPFPRGTIVCVLPPVEAPPKPTLFIRNKNGSRLFSSRFTVADVTDGKIDSRGRAFQFLEK